MTASDTRGGTYALEIEVGADLCTMVGALGEYTFPAGRYVYVGSALGQGGFKRIDRHRAIANGDHDTRHWHIDYLLGSRDVMLASVFRLVDVACECELATAIPGRRVAAFGASDCSCGAHLIQIQNVPAVRSAIDRFRDPEE